MLDITLFALSHSNVKIVCHYLAGLSPRADIYEAEVFLPLVDARGGLEAPQKLSALVELRD
jgi:hypothetical protein